MSRLLVMCTALSAASCMRLSDMGDSLEEAEIEASAVADERLATVPDRPSHFHGPDLPYLRAGCSAWNHRAEAEPDDPPIDPSDEFAAFYVKAPPLAKIAELRVAPRGTLAYLREGAIWISAADGTSRRRLVQAPWKASKTDPVAHGAPHWIFGGDELLFVTTRDDPRGRLVRLDRDCRWASSIGTRICADETSCSDPTHAKLVVSRDGRRVLVEGTTGPASPLRLLDLATGREEIIARDHYAPAAWSPAGDRIAYRPGYEQGIAVLDLASGARDVVTHPSTRDHGPPVFADDGLSLWFTATRGFDEFTVDTEVLRTTVPHDLRTHVPPPPYAREHLVTRMGFFGHPYATITRGPNTDRIAVTEEHRMGGLGDPWVSTVAVIPIGPSAKTVFTFGKGRSAPHHNEWGPAFSPDGELVAATLETCVVQGCTRGTQKIAISDGVVDAFVATGRSVDWTDADP